MRPTLVNGLALIGAVTIVSVACSRASEGNASKPSDSAAITATAAAAPAGTARPADSIAKAADAARVQGSPTARLWVIEVSDFQCPFCKMWHDDAYAMVLRDYVASGKIRFAYINFPLSMHKNARQASIAAMCAAAQGKFWPMHDSLFAKQKSWETLDNPAAAAAFASMAASVGANSAAYQSCLAAPSIPALIEADQDRASRGGVQSTPSFWVGGKLLEGAIPAAGMKAAIDEALATTK